MKKRTSFSGLMVVLFLICIFIAFAFRLTLGTEQEVPPNYTDLIKKIEAGEVKKLEIVRDPDINNAGTISATLSDETIISVKSVDTDGFMNYVMDGIVVKGWNIPVVTGLQANTGYVVTFIINIAIILGSVFLLFFLIQHMQGGSGGGNRVMNFGKTKVKAYSDDKKKVSFSQVAGLKEEKGELEEIVDFLKSPVKYVQIGARIPKGILLVGPPGTGKTLLAKAVAGEAGVPFFAISGSDFVEMFVGVGASRVRDLFEQAKKNSPCLVFIDEIDAVGRRRGAGLGGGHDEREQTLNQLLVEMDGFGVNEGIIILAATNRADILDPAILRPGRFDRKVQFHMPDVKGREEILAVHSKGKALGSDINLNVIARATPGFTGADLENLMNEGALLAARENKKEINMEDLRRAYIKVAFGTEKKSRVIKPKERKLLAYHEVGHALIQELLEELEPVHIVSIIPTGDAGGYMMPLPEDDKIVYNKKYLEQRIVAILGGRAAEDVVYGDISTGASSDIEKASTMARNMVTKYGMSTKLGPIQFGSESDEIFIGRELAHSRNYGEEVATLIDEEVKRIIDEAYANAKNIISEKMTEINKTVGVLLEKEKITGQEFREILGLEPLEESTGEVGSFLAEKPVDIPEPAEA